MAWALKTVKTVKTVSFDGVNEAKYYLQLESEPCRCSLLTHVSIIRIALSLIDWLKFDWKSYSTAVLYIGVGNIPKFSCTLNVKCAF